MARSRRALLAVLTAILAGCGSETGSPTATTTSRTRTPKSTDSSTESPSATATPDPSPERVELDDDRVRWRVDFSADELAGLGLAEERLFVGTVVEGESTPKPGETGGTGRLTALSLPDGNPVWHRSLGIPIVGDLQTQAGDLFTVLGYSTGFDGRSQRLARYGPDGTRRWESPKRDAWLSVYDFDAGSAYLGTGDDALAASGETTFAVDLETGTERWAVEGGDAFGGRVDDGTLLADYAGGEITSLATADGSELWQRSVEALHGYRQTFPTAAGHLFAAVEDGDSYGIAGIDVTDGSTAWTHGFDAEQAFVVTSATTVGADVVATEYGGLLFALDAATGERRWEQSFETRLRIPLIADGTLYCSVVDGPLVAVDATDGTQIWRAGGSEGYDRLSVVDDTLLIVRSNEVETTVVARRLTDGELRWRRTIPGSAGRVTLAAGTLIVATAEQSVYGLAL